MTERVLFILLVFTLNSCINQSNNTNQVKRNGNDTAQLSIKGVLNLKLNEDSCIVELFMNNLYDSLSPNTMQYSVDSINVLKSTSPQLKEILENTDEDFFHFIPKILNITRKDIYNMDSILVSDNYNDNRALIVVDDINFDGYKDLLLYNSLYSGSRNRFYDIWVYNKKEKKYVLWHRSLKNGLWQIDKAEKKLEFGFVMTAHEYSVETWKMKHDTIGEMTMKETAFYNGKEPWIKREEKHNKKWVIVYNASYYDYDNWKQANKK